MFIHLTPFVPLSFKGEGEEKDSEGASPLRASPDKLPMKPSPDKLAMKPSSSRKVVRQLWHMAGGASFPLLALWQPALPLLSLIALATALALALEVARLRFPPFQRAIARLIAVKEREASGLSAATYLLLANLACFALFPRGIAIASLLFLAAADPVASYVGEGWGRPWLREKSLAGSLAFLGAALGVGVGLRGAVGLSLWVLAAGALTAALTELLSLPPDDNLTVPIAAGGVMTLASWQGW